MALKSDLRFAVVIPLYNHARYIGDAIDSVLGQTRPADEIILIDDGSSDDGYEIAARLLNRHPGASVHKQANAGAHVTINRAIGKAKADYIAILNSDDIFEPDKLARCESVVAERGEKAGLIVGGVRIIDETGATVTQGVTVDWLRRAKEFFAVSRLLPLSLLNENFAVTTSNMVFSKHLWQQNGGFQPLRYCHDLEFLMAAARHGNLHPDDEYTHTAYRIHARNTIKEELVKVRVEIAAVMVSALLESPTSLIGEGLHVSALSALLQVIRAKDLSDLALVLVAVYRHYPTRDKFFTAVTQSDLSGFYRAVLSQPESVVSTALAKACPGRRRSQIDIVVEVGGFDKGGLEKVVLDSAILFKERGINPLVVSIGPIGHLGAVAARHGIEAVRLPSGNWHAFYASLLQVRSIKLAISHFSRTGYGVFKELKIPNITFIHNVYAMLSGEALQNFKDDGKFVDRYIAVSTAAARYAVNKLDVPREKVGVIPNGLIMAEHERAESQTEAASREQFGIALDDFVFLNVASYNLHKAHYLMVEAMQIILKERHDIKIVCIGNEVYAPHVRELRGYLQATGVDKYILMPGYFEEVAALHKMSDAFLLPSFIEGWSIAMNEAMFYSKPMILSDTGGSSEVIESEDIGIIVPNEYGDVLNLDSRLLDELAYQPRQYRTSHHLARAMMRFADNRTAWKNAGKLGRKKVIAKYDFSDVVDKYVAEIDALLP